MFVDLDNFKQINDALGQMAGDEVICEAGRRIEAVIGHCGLVTHLGGDEFNVIIDHQPDGVETETMADEILNAIAMPLIVDGKEIYISASIGVSSYPDNGHSVSEILTNADLALHAAKRKGAGVHHFYTRKLSENVERRMEMERGLRLALDNNEFHLLYQPKVDLGSRKIYGAEALLRWESPDLGSVSPVEFIPVAEECGLISEIGRWVLFTACETAAGWAEFFDGDYHVGVNFAASQFLEPDIVEWVGICIESSGLDPKCLDVELTESMLVENSNKTIEVIEALKTLGISTSMDDFGTGYSSLSYLTRFPLDTLKVDRSFVMNLPDDTDAVAIARAIVSMAKNLDLHIVAEGIETENQVVFLHALGCHTGQGYLFSRPLPNQEFLQLIGGNVIQLHAENNLC